MPRFIKITSLLLLCSFIAYTSEVTALDQGRVLATVNGIPITSDQVGQLPGTAAETEFDALADDIKAQVIIGLINRQLVLEQAKKEGFDRTESMVAAIRKQTEELIVTQYLVKIAAGTDLSDGAIQAAYDETYLDQPVESRVSHILLVSEQEALEVVELLKKGESFPDLARHKSKDKVSAEKGGDLGWLTPADMLPAFGQAVSGLSPGEINSQPIRTQFGWHVIQLADRRTPEPQPLDQVRQSIQQALIQEQISTYLDGLRDTADIQIR